MQSRTFAIMVSVLIMLIVINLIRRQKMTFKYSMLWLATSLAALLFSIFDQALNQISSMMGFALPSNFVFFCLLSFFIIQSLFLTIYVNQQNSRIEALAQAVGILEYQQQKPSDSRSVKPKSD